MDIRSALQPLDAVVIIIYIICLIGLGFWISFRRKESSDLFLAGRDLGWPNIGFSIFGTNISPSMMLAACSVAYTSGIVAANFEWLAWWFLMLLAMVFIPHYLGTRISTMPEFMERRFDGRCRSFLSWYALFTTIILWLGGALYSGGLLLVQITGWDLWLCLTILVAIATSFTITGGLAAVVYTDTFQSVLMIIASTALTIIAYIKTGGIYKIIQSVPSDYWQLFRPASNSTFPWPAIVLGYPVLGIWFWCTDQTIVQRVLGARDTRQGQLGAVFAGFLKILVPFIFFMPGIFCFILYPNLENPDSAYTMLMTNLLPTGLVGLIVAVLIAALISTIDSALNSFSTIFTLDIYCDKFRPGAQTKEIRLVGRIMTLIIAVVSIFIALSMESVGRDLFNLLQGIIAFFAPPMSAVFLIGVLWRRATSKAALYTLIFGSAMSLSIGFCQFNNWPSETFWPHYMLLSFYLFAALSAFMIVVSLVTQKGSEPSTLPTLRETYAGSKGSTAIWVLWGVLAMIMFSIYLIFN
ncbi:MAG: sodium:solute symporter [candidate division KSB1 bacterium]|nr:sodium:solute symporter [candidate division KSB1 bacterium]